MYDLPTVGVSGMVYAMIGMFFTMILCGEIKIINRKKITLFVAGILACLAVSAMKENSNFFLHLHSLFFGMAILFVIIVIREIINYYRN
jgi:hypothetical protein